MLFALVLRNTCISSYKIFVEIFPLLSLLLEKISSGATDAVKCAQNAGKISEKPCLWKYFAGDPMFQICQFSKRLLQYCITIRGKQRTQLSHGKVCCRENQETSQWLLSWTFGGWFNYQMKSNFRYTKISRRRGLTAPYLEFANYSCTSIAIYDFSFGVILKSRLLSQTAAEHVFKVEDK